MENAINNFENPIVIFTFLTNDLQRSTFKIRDGNKFYYSLIGDSLVYNTGSLGSFTDDYINSNPPDIKSYLWRKILCDNRLTKLIQPLKKLRSDLQQEKIPYTIKLNDAIMKQVVNTLNKKRIDFFSIVFCAQGEYENEQITWQEKWALNFFKEKKTTQHVYFDKFF